MIKALIKFAEKGLLPDPLIRLGIRRLCGQRLSEARMLDVDALENKHQQWMDFLTASPVAILPESVLPARKAAVNSPRGRIETERSTMRQTTIANPEERPPSA